MFASQCPHTPPPRPHSVVTCHGFIPENQRLVVRILIKHVDASMPLYYDRPNGVDELLRLATPQAVRALERHMFYDGTFRLSLASQYSVDHDAGSTRDPSSPQGSNTLQPLPAVAMAEATLRPLSYRSLGGSGKSTQDMWRSAEGGSGRAFGSPYGNHRKQGSDRARGPPAPSTPTALSATEALAAVFLAEDAFSAGLRSDDLKVKPLWYHARLLQLLTACCYGQNFEVEAKCQDLIPLANLVEALRRKDLPLALRLPLHEFFLETWLYVCTCCVLVTGRRGRCARSEPA